MSDLPTMPPGWNVEACVICEGPTAARRPQRLGRAEKIVMLAEAGFVTQLGQRLPGFMCTRGRGQGCKPIMIDAGPLVCCDACERTALERAGREPVATHPDGDRKAIKLEMEIASIHGTGAEVRLAILACKALGDRRALVALTQRETT